MNDRDIDRGTSMRRKLHQSAIVDGFGTLPLFCWRIGVSVVRASTEITVKFCTEKRVPAQPGKLNEARLIFQEYQRYSKNNTRYREEVPVVLLKIKPDWFNADVDRPIWLNFP